MIRKPRGVIKDPKAKNASTWRAVYDGQLLKPKFDSPRKAKYHVDQIAIFRLGKVLADLTRNGSYASKKYDETPEGFAQFCKDEVGIDYRQARYYIQAYKTFKALGRSENDFARIGISKAVIVAQLGDKLTKTNIGKLLRTAEENDRESLIKAVRKFRAKTSNGRRSIDR